MRIHNVLGTIQISHAAVSKIIGKAAAATSGIASMSTGLVEGIANKLSGNSLQNGIELKADESKLEISLSIVIRYGVRMHEVCRELQRNVRETVESMTGLTIQTVNVKVQGIATVDGQRQNNLLPT